jgi:hypothetical protein
MREGWQRRAPGTDAHHIVAAADEGAAVARDILARARIGINDGVNGVFLDSAFHDALHTDTYYRQLTFELVNAEANGTVRETLRDIAVRLWEGTFPH